jgi:predicted nucleic acid-binding protein
MAIVFDTSIFIAFKPSIDIHSSGYLLSAVVIQELMAGARDSSELKSWESIAREFWKQDRLLIPAFEDWFLAGRVLNSLLRGLKSERDGRTPKLHPAEKQRIIRDVLIARTVRRVNRLLITDNINDFKRIKKFCNVRLQSGEEFFGS